MSEKKTEPQPQANDGGATGAEWVFWGMDESVGVCVLCVCLSVCVCLSQSWYMDVPLYARSTPSARSRSEITGCELTMPAAGLIEPPAL